MDELRSGTAVFRTAADGRILDWNDAAVRLTGVQAGETEGRCCWEVLGGRDASGGLVCHAGCSTLRLARERWPVRPFDLHVRLADGDARLTVSTIVLGGDEEGPLLLHTMSEPSAAPGSATADEGAVSLTPRQREILHLLAQGIRPRQIASRLTLSETTVRNHVQAILLALGVHSQLEAVVRARTLAIVRDRTAA